MKSPSFLSIGANGTWLSSITPTGYANNCDLKDAEETLGEFNIQLLTSTGARLSTYLWAQTYDTSEEKWNDDGHWIDPETAPVVPGGANDLLLSPGAGLWFQASDVSDDDSEAAYSAVTSGQVSTNDVSITLVPGGCGAFGNPYPVAIKLSSLVPTGYQDNEDLKDAEETLGEFNIQLLTATGARLSTYLWAQTYDAGEGEWNDDGHWIDPETATVVPGGANDLTINPGDGLWIQAADKAGDDEATYSITFSYPNS